MKANTIDRVGAIGTRNTAGVFGDTVILRPHEAELAASV